MQVIESDSQPRITFMVGECQLIESDKNKIIFLLDSGASDHIINREDIARNFDNLQKPIKISVAKSGESISTTK